MRSFATLFLTCFSVLVTASELAWPIVCPNGDARSCLITVGYPDIDGDNLTASCNAPLTQGHTGTDFIPTAESVELNVEVVAAAPGKVIFMQDEMFDGCPADHEQCRPASPRKIRPGYVGGYTSCTYPGAFCKGANSPRCFWCFSGNYVVLQHEDEDELFATAYLHLKKGSVPLTYGQQVDTGDLIGLVGSSGNSEQAHLHFEVWRRGLFKPVDPWSGVCGNDKSRWSGVYAD